MGTDTDYLHWSGFRCKFRRGTQLSKIFLLLSSSFGGAAATFGVQLSLSRMLTPHDFGSLALANSVILTIAVFGSSGIVALLLRRASIEPLLANRYLNTGATCLSIVSACGYIITVVILAQSGFKPLTAALLSIGLFAISLQALVTVLGQIQSSHAMMALSQVLTPLLRVLSCIPLVFSLRTIDFAAMYLGLAASLSVIAYLHLYIKNIGEHLSTSIVQAVDFIKRSAKYSVNGGLNIAQLQLSIAIVGLLYGPLIAAHLALANTLLAAVYIAPNTVFNIHFLKKYHQLGKNEIAIPIRNACISLMVGVISAAILYFLAAPLITALFGAKYRDAIPLLQLVCISIPFRFFATGLGAALLSETLVKQKLIAASAGFAVLALLLVNIGGQGPLGVGLSVVISEVSIACMYFVVLIRKARN